MASLCWASGWGLLESSRRRMEHSWSSKEPVLWLQEGIPNAKLSSVPACLRAAPHHPLQKDRLLPRAQTCTCQLIYLLCLFSNSCQHRVRSSVLIRMRDEKKALKNVLGISCSQSPFVTPVTAGLKILCSARGLGGWKEAAHQHELCSPSTKASGISGIVFLSINWGLAQRWKTNESGGFSWGLGTPFWTLKMQRC